MSKDLIKIGFVGAGRVADVHYDAIQKCNDLAKFVAFCDIRKEAISIRQEEWDVPGFLSMDEMLTAIEIDAVAVLLPHNIHLEFMRDCLSRGLPVLLEKPLAGNLQEAKEIVQLTEKANVPVLVGHNGLFHPAIDAIVQFVEEGWIGKPLMASAKSLQWLGFKPWDFRLNREQTGGGAWVDCAGHLIYRLNAILGEVDQITGFTADIGRKEMEGEDSAVAVVRYASGVIAQIAVSYGCKMPGYELDWPSGCEQNLIISGDMGMVEYHICPESRLRYYTEKPGSDLAKPGTWAEVDIKEPFEVSFDIQMRHFLECVLGNEKPKVTVQNAYNLLKTLLSLYEHQTD
ncbi:Gfo/Idh/MocA family protein [Bacteroidota bacterium]